jgi:hypothetical protein
MALVVDGVRIKSLRHINTESLALVVKKMCLSGSHCLQLEPHKLAICNTPQYPSCYFSSMQTSAKSPIADFYYYIKKPWFSERFCTLVIHYVSHVSFMRAYDINPCLMNDIFNV